MNHIQLMRISYVTLLATTLFFDRPNTGQNLLCSYREFFNEFDNRDSEQRTQEDFEEIASIFRLVKQRNLTTRHNIYDILMSSNRHNSELNRNIQFYADWLYDMMNV